MHGQKNIKLYIHASAGFDLTIPTTERPQTHALHPAASAFFLLPSLLKPLRFQNITKFFKYGATSKLRR